jgi:hypothetical protein
VWMKSGNFSAMQKQHEIRKALNPVGFTLPFHFHAEYGVPESQ